MIYNSPYYGFETKAELFFDLVSEFDNLVGFKEFGGAKSLSYAAEHITAADPNLHLADTQVVHMVCGANGVISGIGNALPETLRLVDAATRGARHASRGRNSTRPSVLARFDEGPDLSSLPSPDGARYAQPVLFRRLERFAASFRRRCWRRFRRWWA